MRAACSTGPARSAQLLRTLKPLALQGAEVSASLEDALRLLAGPQHAGRVEHVFVIGGGQVYAEALASPLCTAVHLTQVGR